MSQVSPFLRKVLHGYAHFCPGCDEIHVIWTDGTRGPNWTFNGDVNKPDFKPSVRVFHPKHTYKGVEVPEETICHYFINEGKIAYCGDCEHELKGQTVDLPSLPERFSSENYSWGNDEP